MNYYEILEIPDFSSLDKIKKAYRKLAKKYHPDKHSGNKLEELANEKFIEINKAYESLKNKKLKSDYDRKLRNKRNSYQSQRNTSNDNYHSTEKSKRKQRDNSYDNKEKYNNAQYNYNYNHFYKEEYSETRKVKNCFYHPQKKAKYTCSECHKAICTECSSENHNDKCIKCINESVKEIYRDYRKSFLSLATIIGLVVFFLLGKGQSTEYSILLLIGYVFISNRFKVKDDFWGLFTSNNKFQLVAKFVGMLLRILFAFVIIPIEIFLYFKDLLKAQRKYIKLMGVRNKKMTLLSSLVVVIVITVISVPFVESNAFSEISLDEKSYENVNENGQVFKLTVNNRGVKDIRGSYIERVDSSIKDILGEGKYLNGTTIELLEFEGKYSLEIIGSRIDPSGNKVKLDKKVELPEEFKMKFYICNDYVDVNSYGKYIGPIASVKNIEWLSHSKYHEIEFDIK